MSPQCSSTNGKDAPSYPSISLLKLIQLDREADSATTMSANPWTSNASRSALHKHKRLVLCFDGTAESFKGNSADSNVVKLYSKFDRIDMINFIIINVKFPNHLRQAELTSK